jgi:catechol 2,3-dioxygenase-like lactoylglutathione lyase family enzyme
MIKRLDRIEVATSDLKDAIATYERNFGFEVSKATGDDAAAVISIGGAEIQLVSGAKAARTLSDLGEGMAALWLEAEDVERVADALGKAGVGHSPIRKEGDRRVLTVDSEAANRVPLFIFDRKG